MDQSTAVCVIGPGRAGTSVTMRVLNLLGVDVGPEEGLVGAGPGGPKGFWERLEIIRMSDRLLRSQGGSWRKPPRLPSGWETAPELAAERKEARAILDAAFAGRGLWGWKDPRASLITAFWLCLVPHLRFVICLRSPIDTTDSLAPPPGRKRDEAFYYSRRGFGGERAYRLWMSYVSAALANTAGRPRLLVSYDEYFDDRDRVIERLARFVDRPAPPAEGEVRQLIDDFIDPRLRHYRTTPEESLRDERLPADVAALYAEAESLRAAQDGLANAGDANTVNSLKFT